MNTTKPNEHTVKNATKIAIVLLTRANDYIKSVYRNILSLNHAAKVYNIKLPEVITEECNELQVFDDTYQLLRANGKINADVLGAPDKFADIKKFRQIYQPIYNRALVVCDKYPMTHHAIMSGMINIDTFLENKLTVLEYSAKRYFDKAIESMQSNKLNINHADSMFDINNWSIPSSWNSPVLRSLPGHYFAEYYDVATNTFNYTGKIYFEMYPDRLFEYCVD